MNADERQTLREKHVEQYGLCVFCFEPDSHRLGHVLAALYLCDTIKVLNALEQVLEQVNYDIDSSSNCEHVLAGRIRNSEGKLETRVFIFCPTCGKTL